MRDYKITRSEFTDYLKMLRSNIFKILPLYEEENVFLFKYVDDLANRLIYLKEVIPELDNGFWYIETGNALEELMDLILGCSHEDVRTKVLYTTNLIDNEIKAHEKG